MLTDLLALAVPATVTVLVTALLKGVADLIARYRKRAPQDEPARIVLPPGVRAPPQATTRRRLPRVTGRSVFSRLRPLPWRASPWTAALIGGPLLGFGIAGYFRTRADGIVGLVLMTPMLLGVALSRDEVAIATEDSAAAGWVNAIVYANMALTATYSYFRAVSSNRRLAASGPNATTSARAPMPEDVLNRELQILAAQRWRVHSASGLEAIVVRQKRPNHALHLALTIVTLYLWTFVWIAKTRASRRNPQYEYRRLVVDAWGHWSVEDVPPAMAESLSVR